MRGAAAALLGAGVGPRERVAVYLEKRIENVAAMFGAAAAGAVFVPVNPLLKPEQVAYILADCNVRVLVTSGDRLRQLAPVLAAVPGLHTVFVVGAGAAAADRPAAAACCAWERVPAPARSRRTAPIDADMAAILYTSGSTGKPKGVVLSHRNMVAGARSVAGYLGNTRGRPHPGRAAAQLRLRPEPADHAPSTPAPSVVLINHLFAARHR